MGTMTTKPETSDMVAGDVPGDVRNDWRAVLQAAALMRDVGKAKGAENHQKHSYRMIRGLARPLGWSARELELAAVVARYHRGALPRLRGKSMQTLEMADRRIAMELAGVLRLANALDMRHGPRERKLSAARSQRAGPLRCGAGGGILGAGPFGGRCRRGAAFAGDGAAPAGAGAGVTADAAPKGAIDHGRFAASLKRCPDTNKLAPCFLCTLKRCGASPRWTAEGGCPYVTLA